MLSCFLLLTDRNSYIACCHLSLSGRINVCFLFSGANSEISGRGVQKKGLKNYLPIFVQIMHKVFRQKGKINSRTPPLVPPVVSHLPMVTMFACCLCFRSLSCCCLCVNTQHVIIPIIMARTIRPPTTDPAMVPTLKR